MSRENNQFHVPGSNRFKPIGLGLGMRLECSTNDLPKCVHISGGRGSQDCKVLSKKLHFAVALLILTRCVIKNHTVNSVHARWSKFEQELVSTQSFWFGYCQDRHVFVICGQSI